MTRIAVVGAGSIGVAWALVFARAGHDVALHDADPDRLSLAFAEGLNMARALHAGGLLAERPLAVLGRIAAHADLGDALAGAAYVQENAPEDLGLKRDLFARLDALARPGVPLASSSSTIIASCFAAELPGRARCLVVHPANPPHLLPVAEVVPAPFTDPAVIARTEALLTEAGMTPVRLGAEVEGFIYNRLQGAVLREAYCLVRDGVADVEAVDRVMREGLGRRWAVVGPFETVDLNTRGGIAVHAQRMGPAYERMGAERGQHDPWTPALVARVARERRAQLALADWPERVRWRDEQLIALERARRAAV